MDSLTVRIVLLQSAVQAARSATARLSWATMGLVFPRDLWL
jgi:hypothetical protein